LAPCVLFDLFTELAEITEIAGEGNYRHGGQHPGVGVHQELRPLQNGSAARGGYGWYLIVPEALKDVPRIKAFNQFIVARASTLKRLQDRRRS
jgi:hypothetical protein